MLHAASQEPVGDFDVQATGEALVAVGAGQGKSQLMFAVRFGAPEPFVEAGCATVQAAACGVDVNRIAPLIQSEATAGDPVGEPADQGPEISVGGVEVSVE